MSDEINNIPTELPRYERDPACRATIICHRTAVPDRIDDAEEYLTKSHIVGKRGAVPDVEGEEHEPQGVSMIVLPEEAPADLQPVVDVTASYIENSDSLWLKEDRGEYVKSHGKTFQRAEDQWEPDIGTEYFQVVRDKLDPDELKRTEGATEINVSDIRKAFVCGIKDGDLKTMVEIGGRQFVVEDSNGGDGDTWSVTYVAVE